MMQFASRHSSKNNYCVYVFVYTKVVRKNKMLNWFTLLAVG